MGSLARSVFFGIFYANINNCIVKISLAWVPSYRRFKCGYPFRPFKTSTFFLFLYFNEIKVNTSRSLLHYLLGCYNKCEIVKR